MPKPKIILTRDEKRKRIDAEVQRRVAARTLEAGEGDDPLDRMVRKSIKDHGA